MRICFFGKPDAPQMSRMAAALSQRGCHVHVVYRSAGSIPGATYETYGVPPAGLMHPHRWARRKRDYLRRFMRDFDVVSIQFLHNWGFTPEIIEEGCFTVRPWGSDICPPPGAAEPHESTLANRRMMLRSAHGVAVTCDAFRGEVAAFAGIDASAITCTPLGVDLDAFKPEGRDRKEPIVGFLKGFGPAYGAEHLIRAMPRILAQIPGAMFEMAGSGPLLQSCQMLAGELGVAGRIRWLGRIAHEQVPELIGRWQVSVIPSLRESFGVAALECSAMEIPVVASGIGGLRETVVDGVTGVLTPPGDSDAIAAAVVDLLGDAGKRRVLGAAGREHVQQRYEWGDCVTRWMEFFKSTADARRGAAISA